MRGHEFPYPTEGMHPLVESQARAAFAEAMHKLDSIDAAVASQRATLLGNAVSFPPQSSLRNVPVEVADFHEAVGKLNGLLTAAAAASSSNTEAL